MHLLGYNFYAINDMSELILHTHIVAPKIHWWDLIKVWYGLMHIYIISKISLYAFLNHYDLDTKICYK